LTGNKLCLPFDNGKRVHGQPGWRLLIIRATSREACGSEKCLRERGSESCLREQGVQRAAGSRAREPAATGNAISDFDFNN